MPLPYRPDTSVITQAVASRALTSGRRKSRTDSSPESPTSVSWKITHATSRKHTREVAASSVFCQSARVCGPLGRLLSPRTRNGAAITRPYSP